MVDPETVQHSPSLAVVIRDGLRSTRGRSRWMLVGAVVVLGLVAVLSVWDLWTEESRPGATYQAWGVSLAIAGLTVFIVAHTIHAVAQKGSACSGSFKRLRTRRLHEVLRVLPALGMIAACLLAAAAALQLVALVAVENKAARPWLGLVLGCYVAYVVWVVRTVSESTQFLFRHAREQAAAAAEARAEATEATLSALQAQMNPHFLFNTLNTVASLIRTDPPAAESTIENLAQIMRRTLERSRQTLTTVREEIDFLKAYLSVEQERFGPRLRVSWEIDARALDAPIPPMTLQPLVENALKHGIGVQLPGGELEIRAQVVDDQVRLEVADDGPGFPRRVRDGTGLQNLRRRLATLYGGAASLEIRRPARIVVTLPLTSPAEPAARLPSGDERASEEKTEAEIPLAPSGAG